MPHSRRLEIAPVGNGFHRTGWVGVAVPLIAQWLANSCPEKPTVDSSASEPSETSGSLWVRVSLPQPRANSEVSAKQARVRGVMQGQIAGGVPGQGVARPR